jgi:hypothetical protein
MKDVSHLLSGQIAKHFCVSCVCSESLYFMLSGLWSVIRWCCNAFRSSREDGANSEAIERGSRHNRDIARGARRFNDATLGEISIDGGEERRRRILIDFGRGLGSLSGRAWCCSGPTMQLHAGERLKKVKAATPDSRDLMWGG